MLLGFCLSFTNAMINDLGKLFKRFLWNAGDSAKGKARIAWKVVCRPKDQGGLGIKPLKRWNEVIRQFWKILENKKSLWAEWVNVVKLKNRSVLNVPGNTISIWYDKWSSNGTIRNFISQRNIYDARLPMDVTVTDVINKNRWIWPNEWISKFPELQCISIPPTLNDNEDKVIWVTNVGKKVCFSTKQAWLDMRDDFPKVTWNNVIWFKQLMPRHGFILWLVIKKILLTQDKTGKWKNGVTPCVLPSAFSTMANQNPTWNIDADNNCTMEFDAFGFSVKDFLTRHILLRCDSSGYLYPVTSPSPTPHALLFVSSSMWHQRLGHPGEYVLRSLSLVSIFPIIKRSPHIFVMRASLENMDPISDPTLYRSLTIGLQYLTFTRPDISYVVQLAFICMILESLIWQLLREFSDMRSTFGYCVFLGDNILSWLTKRQHTLSRSSVESEYRGVANVVAEIAWLSNLLRELHKPLLYATLIYCDNVSAIYMTANPVQHQQTKHIEIDIHFVHDMVARGQVRVLHVPSRYQYTDIFTK
ncbi:ribonuclease H-like domain-containing protein [Tanacetum coccineum]